MIIWQRCIDLYVELCKFEVKKNILCYKNVRNHIPKKIPIIWTRIQMYPLDDSANVVIPNFFVVVRSVDFINFSGYWCYIVWNIFYWSVDHALQLKIQAWTRFYQHMFALPAKTSSWFIQLPIPVINILF